MLPVEPDEPQVIAAKDLLRTQRQLQTLAVGGLSAVLSSFTAGAGSAAAAGPGSSSSSVDSQAAGSNSVSVSHSSASRTGADMQRGVGQTAANMSMGAELLREDEELQELLRDEVVEQLGGRTEAGRSTQQSVPVSQHQQQQQASQA